MFKFDPNSTVNEGRWRLKDPKIFRCNSYFRRKSSEPGISYICGLNMETRKIDIQAIRFNKSMFTEATASIWWNSNKDRFEKTWTEEDWLKEGIL